MKPFSWTRFTVARLHIWWQRGSSLSLRSFDDCWRSCLKWKDECANDPLLPRQWGSKKQIKLDLHPTSIFPSSIHYFHKIFKFPVWFLLSTPWSIWVYWQEHEPLPFNWGNSCKFYKVQDGRLWYQWSLYFQQYLANLLLSSDWHSSLW